MKKTLMVLAIVVALSFIGKRLFDFYQDHVPVAKPGQCVHITDGQLEATIEILFNNSETGQSVVVSHTNGVITDFSFQEMRELNAKIVKCP